MDVETAGGEDLALAGDGFRPRADDDVDAALHVRVSGLADADDPSIAHTDIGLENAGHVENRRVGDDQIDRTL